MGLNPAHFQRAYAASTNPVVFPIGTCSNVWPRFSWQNNDQVSHEELAFAIQSAEHDLTDLVGHFPSPDWVEQEVHMMTREFDRQYFSNGLDIRGLLKKVDTNYAKVINGGVRAVSLIGAATTASGSLAYQDVDGDGLEELAVITLATTLTVPGEIKVYFSGMGGDRDWEIRPVKSIVISGGIVVIKIDAWMLIDPELLSDYPTADGFRAIDISTPVNYVTAVDVYREYNDNTQVSAEFVWQSVEYPATCTVFSPNASITSTQNGVTMVADGELGLVTPVPATYVVADATWRTDAWTENIMPDYSRLFYYSGEYSNAFLRGFSTDALSDWWAQTIAWVATARLTRPLCGCASVTDMAEHLSEDLSLTENSRAH